MVTLGISPEFLSTIIFVHHVGGGVATKCTPQGCVPFFFLHFSIDLYFKLISKLQKKKLTHVDTRFFLMNTGEHKNIFGEHM